MPLEGKKENALPKITGNNVTGSINFECNPAEAWRKEAGGTKSIMHTAYQPDPSSSQIPKFKIHIADKFHKSTATCSAICTLGALKL